MRTLIVFTLVFQTIGLHAQETFTSIRGTLVDSKSREFIPFASVYIKGRSIGTTTNDEGRFLFHVPSGFDNDTLVISVIGYDHFMSAVSRMTKRKT